MLNLKPKTSSKPTESKKLCKRENQSQLLIRNNIMTKVDPIGTFAYPHDWGTGMFGRPNCLSEMSRHVFMKTAIACNTVHVTEAYFPVGLGRDRQLEEKSISAVNR